ncbi:two-component system sensor histidine kinase RppB [Aphanothece sacrum]|uniref:histidine kinase n=1 Tax=Aphanothece sacrum FPU1 TaxID=1920663 RepID=A0A401ILS5_APHSA|nr:two-component system sensor histidine kinase RppB [Aphanothece sacrum]GBF82214.1 two-component sensor histidine kinase [Aphanothece sacrum FPU1]GBF87248.1 two-component sensor histidine kinase [Aphanothece sacrum FPU3]
MKQKQPSFLLFKKARWRLASWYGAVISIVLGILGIGVYEAIIHAHQITVEKELKTVAGTLHDSLETILNTPGKLEDKIMQFLPNLCPVNTTCLSQNNIYNYRLGAIEKGQYYLYIFDLSGNLIALSKQNIKGLDIKKHQKQQEILKDTQGIRYLQISYMLHNKKGENWGYIQVIRSLEDFDNYLNSVALILLLGLPLAVILIGLSAWILTGLAIKPVYQSYCQIQQFTADAAHELRTPLAAILATIESTLMLSTWTEEDAKETLQSLKRQTERLSALVADLLMLSRLDWQLTSNAVSTIKYEKICLNYLINDVIEELAFLAISLQIFLQSEIRVNHRIEILGDPEKIYRLLFNLVVNAIQYTPPKGEVKIILEEKNKLAIIKVKDTGIGINSPESKHIFERFYRIDKGRSRKDGGSGLGLSIAQAIAQAHHGTIEVKSEVEKGSLFIVQLPINF